MLQLSAGRGPAECCWVVANVLKVLLNEARQQGMEAVVLSRTKGPENGTLQSALVRITADDATQFLKSWVGAVQWIGQSKFRKFHKRKNWFIAVALLDVAQASEAIREQDIRYTAIRSGGPGGQHVNKVSTAIRATHEPTGLTVLASDSRSQVQNRKNARLRLLAMLEARHTEQQVAAQQDAWQQHTDIERGNPVRVFKGSDFKRKPVKKKAKHNRQQLKADLRRQEGGER